jgi:hypothetical protein
MWHFATMADKLETQADQTLTGAVDKIGPWTIKSVATETRDLAIMLARREGLTVGQWLERRVREWAEEEVSPNRPMSARIEGHVSPGPTGLDAAMLAAEIVRKLADIPGLPESVRKSSHSVLRERLKRARA